MGQARFETPLDRLLLRDGKKKKTKEQTPKSKWEREEDNETYSYSHWREVMC